MITATELQQKYLDFFSRRSHAVLPSASLVPANDPTVLFTTAGMHPLVPHLLGEPHPAGRRLTSCQKCVRTGDIDEVGDATHLTFFEMLGNWSLGDYFRDDAIRFSFEFLTDPRWLGLSLERLGVTCFEGDAAVPRDVESVRIWESLGVPRDRIQFLGREHNWWGPAGTTGPCGPDTEIFYWIEPSVPAPRVLDVSDARWVELYNDVFMAFTRTADGRFEPLEMRSVDTGMGVERTLAALNGLPTVYDVDTVCPILEGIRASGAKGDVNTDDQRLARIVTDHVRAASMIIADGIQPSNRDRGYVVRRLIRRAALHARRLELGPDWVATLTHAIRAALGERYPELVAEYEHIRAAIGMEVERFGHTVERGLREIEKRPVLDGAAAFDLYQTYGFPWELTCELAVVRRQTLDAEAFRVEFERHRELSRTASAGSFAGGLADHSTEIVAYHTVTHLLNAALRRVLGEHVMQKGSNITHERLRFDFSHPAKLTDVERSEVERLVSEWLAADIEVERDEMSQSEARALGAIGAFGDKYGERVSVYSMVDPSSGAVVSREFCGGPHVRRTSEIVGHFAILREEPLGAGVRRIKAVVRSKPRSKSVSPP